MLCHCHGTADTYTRHADPETTERFPPHKSLEGNALPLPRNRRYLHAPRRPRNDGAFPSTQIAGGQCSAIAAEPPNRRNAAHEKHPALALCQDRHRLPLCTARVENIRLVSPFITQETAPTLYLSRFAPASVRQFWPMTPRIKSFGRHGAPPIIGQSVAM